eukprot:14251560-Alexandrium_andersonii.AAC.1
MSFAHGGARLVDGRHLYVKPMLAARLLHDAIGAFLWCSSGFVFASILIRSSWFALACRIMP